MLSAFLLGILPGFFQALLQGSLLGLLPGILLRFFIRLVSRRTVLD